MILLWYGKTVIPHLPNPDMVVSEMQRYRRWLRFLRTVFFRVPSANKAIGGFILATHGTFSFAMSLKTLGAPLPPHGPPMHGSGERAAGGDGSRPHRPHAMSQRSMPPLVDPRPIRAPAMQLGSTATSLGFGGTMGSRSAPSLIPPPTPSYLMPTPASVRMKEEMAAVVPSSSLENVCMHVNVRMSHTFTMPDTSAVIICGVF